MMRFQFVSIRIFGWLCLLFSAGCEVQTPQQSQTKVDLVLRRVESPATPAAIENLIQVGPRLYSGGEPKTRAAFAQIAELGCRTIVSVDGAKPNLEWAREFGLTYVHVPIGYEGLDRDSQWKIVNAIRSHQGPIFFHCHHGKHRGPAAAAIGLMADTDCDPATARKLLELSGTSPDYPGLWRDVAQYQAPPADAKLPGLTETVQVDSFVAAMSGLDRTFDALKLCRDAGWKAPPDHPDLDPQSLAILIREDLTESRRMAGANRNAEFMDWLDRSQILANDLEKNLRDGAIELANRALSALEADCLQCHQKYRN